jgi:hypothetical protein
MDRIDGINNVKDCKKLMERCIGQVPALESISYIVNSDEDLMVTIREDVNLHNELKAQWRNCLKKFADQFNVIIKLKHKGNPKNTFTVKYE